MIEIRPVQRQDLAVICKHRRSMFGEMGWSTAKLDAAMATFAEWLAPRLDDDSYYGFLAEEQGADVGGIGLMALEFPPHPIHPESSQRGYILNLFVDPGCRGKGVAKRLMQAGEAEFKKRGIHYAVLHASRMGRPVYERMGWVISPEMAKVLA